ncbi:MAG TPA: hypothetical protein VFW99_00595, partial [Candidatus Nitrosotalea sp.]|nr:hypothetical protein [Candidatus Nitrosotalea sp.]
LSLPNDKVSSKRYAGQRKTTIQKIISLTQDDNAAAYYSGMSDCYDAILAFNEGYTSIEDDSEIALSFFKKSSELATKTIETLNKAQTIHRAKIFIQYNKGLVGAIKAVISYVGGRQNLLVGNSQLAKYDFEKAIKESTKAMEDSQIAGDFSLPLIQVLTNISESSRKFSQNISKTIRQSKRFGISAGSQFGVVFFVTLITFVVLGNFQLFLVSSYIEIYVSLTVASITAFGLNALKLKDLLLPIQSSK